MSYRIFHRRWWKENPNWPQGLEPDGGAPRTYVDEAETEEEARELCELYDSTANWSAHELRLGRKHEYTRG